MHPRTSVEDQDELSSLLQVPLMVCTSAPSTSLCFAHVRESAFPEIFACEMQNRGNFYLWDPKHWVLESRIQNSMNDWDPES